MHSFLVYPLLAIILLAAPLSAAESVPGLKVPEGFAVTEFAGSDLANDVYTMTLDGKGRVFVAGRGYLRTLLDTDGDGKADKVVEFANIPKDGAMGLLWEGDTLWCTGDGGLLRFTDRDGDGKADGPPENVLKLKTGGEHAAHAIRRGPDGWLYVLCGNNTGIDKTYARSALSPVREPVAGAVLRLSPDLKSCEVFADGFRNAYDMDFNADGELFTYDSDNERCVGLPWYEPTRFYHVVAGANHGWRSPQKGDWWRLPPYFVDVSPPVVTLERGSPTGCVCYRHGQFPVKYRGGFFALDWTFGRLWFVSLKREGSTYRATREVFLQATGDNGFAPTAAVVHPETGDLYVSIGGRGTRGAVYRIRYPDGVKGAKDEAAKWKMAPRSLDWQDRWKDELPKTVAGTDFHKSRQALELMWRYRERFDAKMHMDAISANAGQSDRFLRQATARLVATLGRHDCLELIKKSSEATLYLGATWAKYPPDLVWNVWSFQEAQAEERLAYLRLYQLGVGDITASNDKGTAWEGYSSVELPSNDGRGVARRGHAHQIAKEFPSGNGEVDREIARTVAMLDIDSEEFLAKVVTMLGPKTSPIDDIHYLVCVSRFPTKHPKAATERIAEAMIRLDEKIAKANIARDRHWPLRLAEVHKELAKKDPNLNAALLAHRDFGRPDHALWTLAPGFDRKKAAAIFLERAKKDRDFAWNPPLIALIGELPDEQALPVLRPLWDQAGLNDALLPLLIRRPDGADREKFVEGLHSPQPATVRLCLSALEKLPAKKDGETLLALVLALRRAPEGKDGDALRASLAGYLGKLTGETGPDGDPKKWADWLSKTHPDLAKKLSGDDGVDVAAWAKRLTAIDWDKGDAEKGKIVYTKTSCLACHSGSLALGPDLLGVAGRFSRGDLFTAIVQPGKDVSARYRATSVTTADGITYQGVIIYEANDSILLQTGAATTVRLANKQIADKRLTNLSLMPSGLLDRLKDDEIADLYAYLRGLKEKKPRRRRRMATGSPDAGEE